MKTTWTKREKKVKGETKPHPQHLTALQTITPNVEHVLSTTKQCTAERLVRHQSPQDYRNVIRCVDKALLTQLGRTAPQLSAYGHCSWSMQHQSAKFALPDDPLNVPWCDQLGSQPLSLVQSPAVYSCWQCIHAQGFGPLVAVTCGH